MKREWLLFGTNVFHRGCFIGGLLCAVIAAALGVTTLAAEFEVDARSEYSLDLATEPFDDGSLFSPIQTEISASFVAFLGLHRTGNLVDDADRLNAGMQIGFRGRLEVMHSKTEGLELVLSRMGGSRREPSEPTGAEFPGSFYRTSLINGEINLINRETIGSHQRTTILGIRALGTNEELEAYSYSWAYGSGPVAGPTVHGWALPNPQTLDTRLLAVQLGWEKGFLTKRFEFTYGLRSAFGVGHHAYFAVQPNLSSGGFETIETSDFDVGTAADYYLSASYQLGDQLSLTAGLYRLSLITFDNPSKLASGDRYLIRHLVGVNLGASYVY